MAKVNLIILLKLLCSLFLSVNSATKPNVVFILADDLGFNDIGYHAINHGSVLKTPFLDSLALNGVRLENYYVQFLCTPSRSQLMSGRYQIHTGLQHWIIENDEPNGLPLENILLPEQLKNCGYDTHMVGKWHLGFYKDAYVPWNRGFDTFFGSLGGCVNYYTKQHCEPNLCGVDVNTEKGPTNDTYGQYCTHTYAEKAIEIIHKHKTSNPLFLYLAFQSVHTPLQVPLSYMEPFHKIKDKNRRIYAGKVAALDEAIKNVVNSLKEAGLWDNTLLIFSTDNGGDTRNGGNNWPLRGKKASLFEGGIRGVGFVYGKMINAPKLTINKQLIHISDWYPTVLSAAQCQLKPETQSLDGYDQWEAISGHSETLRKEILLNIDPLNKLKDCESLTGNIRKGFNTCTQAGIRSGDWKLLTGNSGFDKWVQPPEMESATNLDESHAEDERMFDSKLIKLFNIKEDPYERNEVSGENPDIVDQLLTRLADYESTAVPVSKPRRDKNSDPKLHGGFWLPWQK